MDDSKKQKNDHSRVRLWPGFHWNIAGFVCACIPTLAAVLVSFDLLTVRAATAGAVCAIGYVIGLTWYFARQPEKPDPDRSQ